jgi:hypothetical protein
LNAKGDTTTWIDEKYMVGDIGKQIYESIDNSKYILVFLTARFVTNLSGSDESDNCQKEFKYAISKKKPFVSQ